ncbi:hypothetical protein [Luteibacter sp. CQ10]|uniref:hypothetical protein n=1 Tax=Luteibacter sp. CQ10 TaxID=2805821 RepID=UPI0034A5744C
MRWLNYPTLLIALFWMNANAGSHVDRSAVDRLHELEKIETDSIRSQIAEDRRDDLIVSSYERLFRFDDSKILRMSVEDLQASFKAAYLATFFGIHLKHIAEMEGYLNALESQHAATSAQYTRMHDMYMAARLFDKANKLREQHPDLHLEVAPLIVAGPRDGEARPNKLGISTDGNTLLYTPIDTKGKAIVVIAHPLCHFSMKAIRDISARSDLSHVFKEAIWLAPPGSSLDMKQVQGWNKSYPAATMGFMYRREDWPMLDAWATPTFYFLNNGKVVARVQGWPPQGGYESLDRAINAWRNSKD